MSSTLTFPHAEINLKDIPVPQPADPTILPLHLPLFMSFAETGPVGVPTLGGTNALTNLYGSKFLDERSVYFRHPNVFIKRALPFQQVYFVRLADPAAVAATFVLLCTVTPGSITQYQRTSSGAIVLDSGGNPVPETSGGGVTVTQPGVTLSFSVRPLTMGETLSTVQTTTVTTGGVTVTTYPLMAFETYVGAGGNNLGFRLFYDSNYDTALVSNIGAMIYSFQPVTLNTNTNIESPIYDIYNNQTQVFSFKPGAYDPSTATYYDLQDVITNAFNGVPGLPYQFYVYGANVGDIGTSVLAVSPELSSLNPYQVNILSGLDANGNPYEHMVVDSSGPTYVNSNVVNYLQGGTDGLLTNTMLEAQTVAFLTGEVNPEIANTFRYPISHIYDSGYTLNTKTAMMGIYGLRDDVKIDFSTQDVSNPPNSAAQDQSTGSALRTAALLYPESTQFGTQACRASIFQQCGTLSDTQVWTNPVPATLDRMIKRCIYNGIDHITGEPKGRPNSEVTIFNITSLNWTPATAAQMQLNWSTGLNYIQYCDVATLFVPDMLSVYPIDTSLLSSDVFVDYTVYLKRIVRRMWTIYVGRDDPPKSLFQDIAKAIDAATAYAFNGTITTETVVSQTAIDSALGYQSTVTVTVSGNLPNRVWKVIVPIQRAS